MSPSYKDLVDAIYLGKYPTTFEENTTTLTRDTIINGVRFLANQSIRIRRPVEAR